MESDNEGLNLNIRENRKRREEIEAIPDIEERLKINLIQNFMSGIIDEKRYEHLVLYFIGRYNSWN